ncbi:hypothetical protein AB5N19_03420 [Seiridium cardinale]
MVSAVLRGLTIPDNSLANVCIISVDFVNLFFSCSVWLILAFRGGRVKMDEGYEG